MPTDLTEEEMRSWLGINETGRGDGGRAGIRVIESDDEETFAGISASAGDVEIFSTGDIHTSSEYLKESGSKSPEETEEKKKTVTVSIKNISDQPVGLLSGEIIVKAEYDNNLSRELNRNSVCYVETSGEVNQQIKSVNLSANQTGKEVEFRITIGKVVDEVTVYVDGSTKQTYEPDFSPYPF